MERIAIILGLLLGLSTGVASAQTRVGVSLSFGDPYFAGRVVIGRPYYHPYSYRSHRYHRYYHAAPVVIVREPRVVIVRPHRYHARRYRGW